MNRAMVAVGATYLAMILALGLAGGTAAAAQARHPGAAGAYEQLLARVKRGDTHVDYSALREGYAASPGYDPYGMKVQAMIGEMLDAADSGDCAKALKWADRVIDLDFVQLDAHIVADYCDREHGDSKQADFHHAVADGLIRSILASGDGAGTATAYVIVSMDEEYAMLKVLGLRVRSQALVNQGGRSYDRCAAVTREDRPVTVYFDVSRPFQSLEKQLHRSKP